MVKEYRYWNYPMVVAIGIITAIIVGALGAQLAWGVFDHSGQGTITSIEGNFVHVTTQEKEIQVYQIEGSSPLIVGAEIGIKSFWWGYMGSQIIPFDREPIPAKLIKSEPLTSPPN